MAFTGKSTYSAGVTLPELAEDVSDLIGIISPYETPLLNALGDAMREATSTHHEWLEDELLPNKDAVNDSTITDPDSDTEFTVDHGSRFRAGDQIQVEGSEELMFVTGINGNALTVVRGYAGTAPENLADNQVINILGNAALEGADKPNARFTNRIRCGNFSQIFTSAVEVSGTDAAASQLGLADEMDYQKQERLRELIRDLENTVINGGQPVSNPEGGGTVRRSMRGIIQHIATNVFRTGDYSGPPYNRGGAYDFTKIFEGGNYAARRRRFRPTLTADKQGKSLGYFLEVSFDNGLHWRQYLDAFNNLLDECGIWLSSDQLDVDTWVAALKGVLKFRMTASVISDERLTCTAADGPEKSAIPVIEHILTLPQQFKYRKVSSRSIFANAGDTLGEADQADDTTALYEFVRKTALAEPEIIATADVQTPYLVLDYQVGDRVTSSPESRDLLGVKSDNRSVSWVERAQMDFKNQCTNLKVVRSRRVRL